MAYYSGQDQSQSVFFYEGENGNPSLLIPDRLIYPSSSDGECAVVVQIDWSRITKTLRPILAGKDGVVALVDADGQLLACSEAADGSDWMFYGEKMEIGKLI